MTDETETTPSIGDNNPPTDKEAQVANLLANNEELVDRKNELMEAAKRVPNDIHIDDKELAGKVADQVKIMKKCAVNADKCREAQKAPYLQAGSVIQKFFKDDIETPLRDEVKKIEKVLTAWQGKVSERDDRIAKEEAAEAARIAEEEAKEAREEAERLAEEAKDSEDVDVAIEAEEAAEMATLLAGDAEQVAEKSLDQVADPKANEKISAEYGARLSSGTRIVHEIKFLRIVDLEALRPYLGAEVIDMAVRAHIKAHGNDLEKIPQIKGIRIFADTKTKVI